VLQLLKLQNKSYSPISSKSMQSYYVLLLLISYFLSSERDLVAMLTEVKHV
jgi:hypothetical protein